MLHTGHVEAQKRRICDVGRLLGAQLHVVLALDLHHASNLFIGACHHLGNNVRLQTLELARPDELFADIPQLADHVAESLIAGPRVTLGHRLVTGLAAEVHVESAIAEITGNQCAERLTTPSAIKSQVAHIHTMFIEMLLGELHHPLTLRRGRVGHVEVKDVELHDLEHLLHRCVIHLGQPHFANGEHSPVTTVCERGVKASHHLGRVDPRLDLPVSTPFDDLDLRIDGIHVAGGTPPAANLRIVDGCLGA